MLALFVRMQFKNRFAFKHFLYILFAVETKKNEFRLD